MERNEQVKSDLIKLLTENTKTEAAAILGISRKTLYKWIHQFGIADDVLGKQNQALSVLRKRIEFLESRLKDI